ncbi:MAG: GNAT family N-acetyltransferase [Lachnospiraceae bacterium]|nr:GNAT family N-acetyltransferase [Lachnospiraceae bacterium]
MKCILITKNNKQLFTPFLPEDVCSGGKHLVFGAYDDEGYVLGAIIGTYWEYECGINWLYVHPQARQCGVATGLLECLIAAVNASWKCPDATLVFDAINDASAKLAGKFFPNGLKVNIYEASAI